MPRFDVGTGSGWHIHHDHIKFGTSTNSRVNFNERSADAIITDIEAKVSRYNLHTGGDYNNCIAWIRNNC